MLKVIKTRPSKVENNNYTGTRRKDSKTTMHIRLFRNNNTVGCVLIGILALQGRSNECDRLKYRL